MVLHLALLAGALLLYPVATTGLLRGYHDSVSDVFSPRTRSGAHYFRPSVLSRTLVAEDELADGLVPGSAFTADFQKPELSLLESTAPRPHSPAGSSATNPTQEPPAVKALRQELNTLLLFDFSLSKFLKRLEGDLRDPANEDRRRMLRRFQGRLNTRAQSREDLRKLIDDAKKSVQSLGSGMKAEVDALASKAQQLQDTYYDTIFRHLPKS